MKPDRVVVVQTCADLQEVDRTSKKPELKHSGQHLVVYVGNMEPQDGVDLLLKSIEHIVKGKERKDALFVIIGSGSELGRLESMAAEMNLNGAVQFTGWVDHDCVDTYLSAADLCVSPEPKNALSDKSSMIKIFEYMAHAKPTVLYDLKEGHRTARDSALYARSTDPADFAEQIERLLDSESLRIQLGQEGRKRVEQELNWGFQSKKLLEAYETLLRG
jgi:glycosyltransferase involved in cell wall biosynthesis